MGRRAKEHAKLYKVAVIGTGFISVRRHLPAWLRLRRSARVVALCDVDEARAKQVAAEFDVPGAYDSLQVMLEAEKPDFVDICTPPRTHADIAVLALSAGAHVLIEKPMAISVQECDRVIEAARVSDREVCIIHSELFYPCFIQARERVAVGDIGEFRGMRTFRSTPRGYMTSVPDHWANRLPGGVIGETGPHVIYSTLAFINPISDIWVHARKQMHEYPWSPFDDYRLELMGADATSSAVLTYTNEHWAAQVDIWGSEGMLKVDLQSKTLVRYDRVSLSPRVVGYSAISEAAQTAGSTLFTAAGVLAGRFRNTHDILIREFLHRTVRGLPSPVTAQEGREAVRVMSLIAGQLEGA